MSTLREKREQAERNLEAIAAVLEGRAGHDVSQYQIGDQYITKMPVMDLVRLKNHWRSELERIKDAERRAAGFQTRRTITTRFV